jgi:phage baseplate assembly protein W
MPTFQTFKDISIAFGSHPNTEDLVTVKNETAIKNALQNLIMTKKGERPFNSQIGSRIPELLFDLMDFATAASIRDEIIFLVRKYEGRVNLRDVIVTPDDTNNAYEVYIEYEIIGREIEEAPFTTEFILQRTR